MKMKIIKEKFFLFITFITLIIQPVILIRIHLSTENNLNIESKKDKNSFGQFRLENYETPTIINSGDPQVWSIPGRVEGDYYNNKQIDSTPFPYNNKYKVSKIGPSITPIGLRSTVIASCPCASQLKCQPCGLTPVLNFGTNRIIDCPCAPKLNCPVCPPLSLIHEIASRKVFIILIRHNKINNWLRI